MKNKTKYSPKERLEIYKKALKEYRIHNYGIGLCSALHLIIRPSGYYICPLKYFPEIVKRKPEKTCGAWWFPLGDKKPRIKILKEAIAELSKKVPRGKRNAKAK